MKAFTDYPFIELGDIYGQKAPIRQCVVISYDGDKYCKIFVGGIEAEVKSGYLYSEAGRCGAAPNINVTKLAR